MISRPNQNHMKQNDLGKSLDPFAHTVLFTNCELKVVQLLFFLNIMLLCVPMAAKKRSTELYSVQPLIGFLVTESTCSPVSASQKRIWAHFLQEQKIGEEDANILGP
jgi:hypothetical protein